MSTWDYLPPEVRAMILEELGKHPQKASYASVSREWQAVIEKSTFHRLKLKENCLDELDQITEHQRGLVRHICLDIELPTYTCICCKRLESETGRRNQNKLATRAICKLFSKLSTWEPTREGLTLELNAYSTSDKEHWLKACYLGTLEEDRLLDSGLPISTNEIDDPDHGWVQGKRVSLPPKEAIRRIYGGINIKFYRQLPQVQAVTKFLLGRQCRRQWTPPTLQQIWEKLPRLEEIVYEPWRLFEKPLQDFQRDGQYYKMVTSHLPAQLRKLSVFEDFNETLQSVFQEPEHTYTAFFPTGQSYIGSWNLDRVRKPSREVAEGFAARSLDLEYLSVAFMAEARHFIDGAKKTWKWHELRSLSLTSRLMDRESDSQEISHLLRDAGAVALLMPKLETMNIWSGLKGEACAFMYRQNDSSITWRGTWEFEFSRDIIQRWKKVVARFAREELQVRLQLLDCEILSHGDAIHHLSLDCVIDPVSLLQIRGESEQSFDEEGDGSAVSVGGPSGCNQS
ncbi:unnamed protein product [Clonostachys byssicola]|uniref:DUF6546 domain-containing protein n=1 Tax=Clonostachys byssicola TaxID=160290 RepID=A0A9N9U153_9HYPO|nr:unnamed protein product [Clonostachys byssicola]